jgi:signal transduction histidine kinase
VPRRHVAPGKLRRRLTVAFVLVAGIASGVLAVGSFVLVRSSRLNDSLRRARDVVETDLRLAASFRLPAEASGLLASVENTGAHGILEVRGASHPSDPGFEPSVPASLRSLVARGQVAYQRVDEPPAPGLSPQPLLIIGGPVDSNGARLYFPFSEQGLHRDLSELRNVLVVGWLIVVAVSAAVGNVLARRTLEPVGRASQAAHDMAEGLLDTRLPEQSQDEFGAWAIAFNRMADALEAKIGALSEAQARERRFTSDVAHELRTPVAALVGEASLLREHLDAMPAEARHLSELVVRDIGRLRRLVDDLMEISRFDARREGVVMEPVDVAALVATVIRTRGWQDAVTLSGDHPVVETDRRRIERIASNLIGNAVEHGGPPVDVAITGDAGGVEVRVTDRGPGIPPESLPHLFERFYKADPSRAGRGSGLGLAIAMENARLLRGTIEAQSVTGLGTTFTVRLLAPPAVSEPLPPGESPVSAPSDDQAVGSSEGGTP